jgi:hypothetical protein
MADRLEQVKAWLNEYDPHDRLEHVDWLIAELEQARQRIAELESLDYERIIQQAASPCPHRGVGGGTRGGRW